MQSIAKELKAHSPARQVEFIVEDNLAVQGDSDLLRIVMENLLSNAWKYTGKRSVPEPSLVPESKREAEHSTCGITAPDSI